MLAARWLDDEEEGAPALPPHAPTRRELEAADAPPPPPRLPARPKKKR
jgi:hypothetical protein